MHYILFILLLPALAAAAAPKKTGYKLEFTYAPQYFLLSQKSSTQKFTGSGIVYRNFQVNSRWKGNYVELDLDFRYSDFDMNADSREFQTYMRDLSLGLTYKNAFLRLENTVSPFMEVENPDVLKIQNLSSNWVSLGYRKIVMPFYRAGGSVSYLLNSDLSHSSLSKARGYKGNLWFERWLHLSKNKSVMLSIRLFGEGRFYDLKTKTEDWESETYHLGLNLGLAKVF